MNDQQTQIVMIRSFTEITADTVKQLPKEKKQIVFNHLVIFLGYLLKLSYSNQNFTELFIPTLEEQAVDIANQEKAATGLLGFLRSKSNVTKAEMSMSELVGFTKKNCQKLWKLYNSTDENRNGPSAIEVLFEQISYEIPLNESDQKHIFEYIAIQSHVLGFA